MDCVSVVIWFVWSGLWILIDDDWTSSIAMKLVSTQGSESRVPRAAGLRGLPRSERGSEEARGKRSRAQQQRAGRRGVSATAAPSTGARGPRAEGA